MKFGKELATQMVPEWRDVYVDYDFLKTLLKEIQVSKQRKNPNIKQNGRTKRNRSFYRAFSGLTTPRSQAPSDVENQVILVNTVRRDGEESTETLFLNATDEGGEYELVFFKGMDNEFNKVVKFYKAKVEEITKEASALNKQMEALIAFRIKVDNPEGWANSLEETTSLASDVAASRAALAASTPSAARATKSVPMEIIVESSSSREQSDESSDDINAIEMKPENLNVQGLNPNTPAPLEILNQVTFNITQETPRSTIKGFFNPPNQNDVKFTNDNLKKAEKQLKKAFIEFYHKLRLLKSYSFLNILAFSKIMKKYDKIASRTASKAYMAMVDKSYMGSCDKVSKLMERTETAFIKHFSNSNRSKGMGILRPKAKKEKHRVTFSTGFLVGCTFALIIALALIVRARNILEHEGKVLYVQTKFPLYSLFGFIVLHMIMYAANIYFWKRYRVNYTFIFGFKEGTELGYREVLLLTFCLNALAIVGVLANLDMEMDPKTKDYKAITELLPLGLLVLVIVTLLCPFNIIYRSSRFFLLVCLFHCVLAPLYKVTLADFFLADELTSQVQAFRSLEFYICYYGWGDYKVRKNSCNKSDVFNTFSFIVAVIPYWWRFLQCLRRLYDEKKAKHGYNALKYLSTILAVSSRTAYTLNRGLVWKYVAWISSAIATIFSTYWDIVIDWGLLRCNSKNYLLRDKLLIPHQIVYFVAMVLNVLLRLAWMQTVLQITIFSLQREIMVALVAALEIIRRGIWNFFRLENEHLNNVGEFRAFKSLPLPFNYYEDEDKDE